MKTYTGPATLKCEKKTCKKVKGKNVQADCINCENCTVTIIDLEKKPLAIKGLKNGR